MTDPIGDMFTRIRNGYASGKEQVVVSHSKLKLEIAKFLEKKGYLASVSKRGRKLKKTLEFTLAYKNGQPAVSAIKRISKPSCRVYRPYKELFPIGRGHASLILSTPKGILSDKEAKKEKVGGEVIGEVW